MIPAKGRLLKVRGGRLDMTDAEIVHWYVVMDISHLFVMVRRPLFMQFGPFRL